MLLVFNFVCYNKPMIFGKILKDKEHYAVALDVGTEFAKALVFKVEDDRGTILGVGRQRQGLSDMQGGTVTDIAAVVSNCSKALERAFEAAGVEAREVSIGIAGELVKGITTTVHYERAKPNSKINIGELKEIIKKVQDKAIDQAYNQIAWETGRSEIDVRLVNSAVTDVRIDGYRVINPLGFQGKDVSVSIFNAFAPLVHLSSLETIAEELDLDLLGVTAEPYAVARAVIDKEAADFSAIFMDVGGGTTDIAVVRSGGVEGTKMFALGGRAFTKRIADNLDLPFQAAEDLKIGYSRGEVDEKSRSLVESVLKNDVDVWLAGVQLALSEFSNVDLLPSKILLCGGGSQLPEIKQALESPEWTRELPFARRPKVSFIQPDDILGVIDRTGLLVDPQDITPMALASLSLDLVSEDDLIPSILRKTLEAVSN